MPKFLVRWKMNPHMIPADPEAQGKLMSSLFQMAKDDEKAGVCLNWAMFPEASGGISFSHQSEEELASILMKYYPYIFFKVKPLLSLDQSMRAFQKTAQSMKK
jgi:hypothetical protein